MVKEEQTASVSRINKLEAELERQQRYSRRSNVLLYGMEEDPAESCSAKVTGFLRRYFPHKKWSEEDVERTHRLGTKSAADDRPRPLIIRFQRNRLQSATPLSQQSTLDAHMLRAAGTTDRAASTTKKLHVKGSNK
ncbi:hypothetical protein ACOMHN_003935 [Nucella lapillus]